MRIFIHSLIMAFLLAAGPVRAALLPDPTKPAEFRPESPVVQEMPKELTDWKVTAIRIAGKQRTAIVNGAIVREGDTVGQAKVLEIRPVSVVLDYDDKKVAVRLFADLVKKKSRENQ